MKKIICLVLAAVLCLAPVTLMTSADGDTPIKVLVNSQPLVTDVPPVIVDGRTLVPLRAIFEALGAEVSWDADTQTVTGTRGNITIELQIGSQIAKVGSATVTLDVPAAIIDNRTFVPARFVAESMGASVNWDEASRTVLITAVIPAPAPTPRPSAAIIPTDSDITQNPLYVTLGDAYPSPDATITIDKNTPLFTTSLDFGMTHTHYRWQDGLPDSVARAKELMKSVFRFDNTHIQSFGPTYITTDINGNPTNLDDPGKLTEAVNKVTEVGEGVITFCSAPNWMKDTPVKGDPTATPGTTVTDIAVLPEYEDAYATLCADIAQKYPQVKYFQVWNEMKGLNNKNLESYEPNQKGRWDYERYTRFYNKIYEKVKAVRPDAQIGGFYQGMPNDGSGEILGIPDGVTNGRPNNVGMPLDANTAYGINYFLENCDGLDFFCIDRSIVTFNNPQKGKLTDVQVMKLTPVWETYINEIIKSLANDAGGKFKDVPVMFSEYYGSINGFASYGQGDIGTVSGGADIPQYSACQFASIYNHILRGSSGHDIGMLLWTENENIPMNAIFTNVFDQDGGQPLPAYWMMMAYKNWFNHSQLCQTTSTSDDIEVIAGLNAAMIINKRNTPVTVNVNGKGIALNAFGLALIDN